MNMTFKKSFMTNTKNTIITSERLKNIEWGTLPMGSNYHGTLFDPKKKKKYFCIIHKSYKLILSGQKRKLLYQVSFINTCKCNILHHPK
jgi:hypothetical protein